MDVMRKSLSRCVAQGLSVDLSLTLMIVLVLILSCVLVSTLLWHFILDRGKGFIAIRLFEFSHVIKWIAESRDGSKKISIFVWLFKSTI